MAFPSSNATTSLATMLTTLQALAGQTKSQAESAVGVMQTQSVDTRFVWEVLDRLRWLIGTLNAWGPTQGLDEYAAAELPGYSGTLTTDITAVTSAAQSCIDWVHSNFPKDSTNTYVLSEILNADGTRTLRQFTPAQTAGFRTTMQALIATIG